MITFNLDQGVGQVLGNCSIEQLLSRGRLSAVYRGRQLNSGRSVALMVFLMPDVTSSKMRQEFCERFLLEVPALMKLRHSHLLPFYDYGEWEGFPYLITPYTTEGSLATRITQRWSPARILPLLEQVTVGMEYAHSNGQFHGMLSPGNLLLSGDGSFQVAAIGLHRLFQNRGIVSHIDDIQNLCQPKVTAKYIAPEYYQERTITIRTDIYSLGVILVEALSGALLPNDISAQEILSQLDQYVSASLVPVLQHALAINPSQRFRRMSNLFSAYASAISPEEERENRSQASYAQQPPAPQKRPEAQLPEAYYPTYPHPIYPNRASQNAAYAPNRANSTRSSLPFSIAKIRTDVQKSKQKGTVRRRQVTAALAGSAALVIVGVGGLNLVRTLTAKPDQKAQAGPAAQPNQSVTVKGIGQSSQPMNTAIQFIDKSVPEARQRLLIHLPDGSFVAYKQGCTHVGVLVDYNPTTHLLVCPAHGAIFDPAKNGSVVSGPKNIPLPKVAIHVMGNGAIMLA
jgi:serine/threonine protein kinase/nitrite reductase/ring-hydroxylating ferredoxin subunit